MVVNKNKKVTKYRAYTTHGGGHRKKRRGAGSRGGRGRAGSGKRAGHKKAGGMTIEGKKGFRPLRTVKKVCIINVGDFTEDFVTELLNKQKITKEGDHYILDLTKLGYTKLLGTGNVNLKLKITVPVYSAKAAEKVKQAGGEIVLSGEIVSPK